MVFSFGLTQFYLFLNVTQSMILMALFVGAIFSAIAALIKVRYRGYFFLFVLGGLLLINGTAFLLNQRYFNLNEVPYLIEIETITIQIDHVNQKPSHFRYDVDGEPYVLIYYEGYEGIYIHQIQEELKDSMTLIDTLDHSVDSITQLGDHIYISSYTSQTNGSVIFDFNIRTKSLDEFYASDLKLNVITSLSELYFYEETGTIRDQSQVFYRWNGTDAVYYKTFGFDVLDIVYHPFYNKFYVSIYRDLQTGPGLFNNIFLLNEDLVFDDQVFAVDQLDRFDLVVEGIKIITAIDYEIIKIHFTEIEYTGLYGEPYGWYNTGMNVVLHGDLIDGQYNVITQDLYLKQDFRPWGAEYMFFRESDSNYYAIGSDEISLVRNFSRQINEILIPSHYRHILFWGSMPLIALMMTLGTRITYVPKRKINNTSDKNL
jgi:hypothetical protein